MMSTFQVQEQYQPLSTRIPFTYYSNDHNLLPLHTSPTTTTAATPALLELAPMSPSHQVDATVTNKPLHDDDERRDAGAGESNHITAS
eukprot:7660679-Pyramimonas_sp.AAC.5